MRKLWIILMVLFIFGCSQTTELPIPTSITPAVGKDINMFLVGQDANRDGIYELYVGAQDHLTLAYSCQQVGIDDFKAGTEGTQRNAMVTMADGRIGFVFIEDTSGDLELWLYPDSWDTSGVCAMIDDETVWNWGYIDVVCYQNGFHTCGFVNGTAGGIATIFPDGANNWITYSSGGYTTSTFDKALTGWTISYDGNFYISHDYSTTQSTGSYGTAELSGDQIITDESGNIWLFDLDETNEDLDVAIFDDIYSILLEDDPTLNAITEEVCNLSGFNTLIDYKAVCNFADNTIHIVTVEKFDDGNIFTDIEWHLKYYRRDQNGWSSAVTVDTWTFDVMVADDGRAQVSQLLGTSPQITILSNNIRLRYLEAIPGDPANRDVREWFILWDDYDSYTVVGNWSQNINLDGTSNDNKFVNAPGNHPEVQG